MKKDILYTQVRMYTGYWSSGRTYSRGDIVYCTTGYFICSANHISDNITFPNYEDIYWICLSNDIFNQISLQSPFNKPLIDIQTTQENQFDEITAHQNFVHQIDTHQSDTKHLQMRKRKLQDAEDQLREHRKRGKTGDYDNLRERLMLMKIDLQTKSYIIEKYDNAKKSSSGDYAKNITWLNTVVNLPCGNYKRFPVTVKDSEETLFNFFKNVKAKLDKNILGLEPVKQEIMTYLARKITNPNGKGHVLALCGDKGVGKTRIIKSLADALDFPFYQINFGGLNDVNILTGHSETYVGSKPGRIVDILCDAGVMNPIIYLDEIDKMSDSKSREINGILTHMLDEEQNDNFQDNYLNNIKINLSKVFFVIAFNDITKVDDIVSDRMTVIYVNAPTMEEKVQICKTKMIPEIIKGIKFKQGIIMEEDVIRHVISMTQDDPGVRQIKKNIEKVLNKLNYDLLTGECNLKIEKVNKKSMVNITRTYIDSVLVDRARQDNSYLSMYT
ncbi:AAA family ATPase [bacterium]|nr:AAA family ATPase [bacterium]